MVRSRLVACVTSLSLLLAACGGGGGGSSNSGGNSGGGGGDGGPGDGTSSSEVFQVPDTNVRLETADVQKIISQGVAEANAEGFKAGFVVIDRLGNVLAAYVMNGTDLSLRLPDAPSGAADDTDLQGLSLPSSTQAGLLGGISKALTASYFSSVGGAFSTRTANDIIQTNFPPSALTRGLESGPLFSVQFSQLPCSDVSARFLGVGVPGNQAGTHRGPLGVGADAGAFPLYKTGPSGNRAMVGSVAVIGDGIYGFDSESTQKDADLREETVALAATTGFTPPAAITADKISIDGTLLRYSEANAADFKSTPASAALISLTDASIGSLVSVRGYYDATQGVQPGARYGQEESGVRPGTASDGYTDPDIWVVSDGKGNTRYLPRDGSDAASLGAVQPLTATEVRTMLEEAFKIQKKARAQVRRPVDNRAQNTMAVVDTNGVILGEIRGPDALVDAIDAVPQKARTTAFFSNPNAAADLLANGDAKIPPYVQAVRDFFADPSALTGKIAFSGRAVAQIARPNFPDAADDNANGPLSIPAARFNIFSTGLQSNLITPDIVAHVNYVVGASATDVPKSCSKSPQVASAPEFGVAGNAAVPQNRINNGITVFAGGVPIYRGNTLVGAIGASGDGDDQSDLIAFLGLYNASQKLGGTFTLPDKAIRSDSLVPNTRSAATGQVNGNQRLSFIGCPFAPYIGTSDQDVCQGL